MRYMPSILAKLFKPIPVADRPPDPSPDQVAGDKLTAVVAEFREAAKRSGDHAQRTRLALSELLERVDAIS